LKTHMIFVRMKRWIPTASHRKCRFSVHRFGCGSGQAWSAKSFLDAVHIPLV
jgi:hypothetical protein